MSSSQTAPEAGQAQSSLPSFLKFRLQHQPGEDVKDKAEVLPAKSGQENSSAAQNLAKQRDQKKPPAGRLASRIQSASSKDPSLLGKYYRRPDGQKENKKQHSMSFDKLSQKSDALLPEIKQNSNSLNRSKDESQRRSISNLYQNKKQAPSFMPVMNNNFNIQKQKQIEEEKKADKHIMLLKNENKRIRKQLKLLSHNLTEEINKQVQQKSREQPIKAGMPKTQAQTTKNLALYRMSPNRIAEQNSIEVIESNLQATQKFLMLLKRELMKEKRLSEKLTKQPDLEFQLMQNNEQMDSELAYLKQKNFDINKQSKLYERELSRMAQQTVGSVSEEKKSNSVFTELLQVQNQVGLLQSEINKNQSSKHQLENQIKLRREEMEASKRKLEVLNQSPSLEKKQDGKPFEVQLKAQENPLAHKKVDKIYFQNVKRQLKTTQGSISSMQKKSNQDRLHLERVISEMAENLNRSNLKLEQRAVQIEAQKSQIQELQDNLPRRDQDQRPEELGVQQNEKVEDMVSNINLQETIPDMDREAQEVIANLAAFDNEQGLSSFDVQNNQSRDKDNSLKDGKERFMRNFQTDMVEEGEMSPIEKAQSQAIEEEVIPEGGHGAQPMGRLPNNVAPRIVYNYNLENRAQAHQEQELNPVQQAQTSQNPQMNQVSSSSYEVITKRSSQQLQPLPRTVQELEEEEGAEQVVELPSHQHTRRPLVSSSSDYHQYGAFRESEIDEVEKLYEQQMQDLPQREEHVRLIEEIYNEN